MKLLIISDIHGNWPALQAVLQAEPDADQILCLGDLVNYGPQPAECVGWAMDNLTAEWLIQGNHDRAFGWDEEPHCSGPYQVLAAAVQNASAQLLSLEMKQFLAGLQPLQRFRLGEAVFVACHAVPSDPLYHYLAETAPVTLWESELNTAGYPDFLLLGHTHVPVKTQFRKTLMVNPGSVGQPKHGDPKAAYAVWTDGDVVLKRARYDVEQTIAAYGKLGLDQHTVDVLSGVLRTGGHLPMDQTPYERLRTFMRTHPDKLGGMFFLREELTRKEGLDLKHLSDSERPQWLLNYARAIIQQGARLTDMAPWRWWAASQHFDERHARSELAELLHLTVALAEVLNMDAEELFDAFIKLHGAGGAAAQGMPAATTELPKNTSILNESVHALNEKRSRI
jgi:putative phosphoesterase